MRVRFDNLRFRTVSCGAEWYRQALDSRPSWMSCAFEKVALASCVRFFENLGLLLLCPHCRSKAELGLCLAVLCGLPCTWLCMFFWAIVGSGRLWFQPMLGFYNLQWCWGGLLLTCVWGQARFCDDWLIIWSKLLTGKWYSSNPFPLHGNGYLVGWRDGKGNLGDLIHQ